MFPSIIIETNKNYEQTTLFPWMKKEESIIIKLDAIPIKYMNKNYIISYSFPYMYSKISLSSSNILHKIDLIHLSAELNLSLFSCETYNEHFYSVSDLKYKIPKDKFDDFYFNNESHIINVTHIDYYFTNLYGDKLPPFAYLKCESHTPQIGSILIKSESIYGIKHECDNLVISSLSIKKLLEGIDKKFQFSNLLCDYTLVDETQGVTIIKSYENDINEGDIITEIDNIPIILGNIMYNKIDEAVPIEVYLNYEWNPTTSIYVSFNNKPAIKLEFRDIKSRMNVQILHEGSSNIMKISYQLLNYFYKNNIILRNENLDEYLMNPYKVISLMIEVNEELIIQKYEEPIEITNFKIIL
jgi:hypothetical protein